MKRRLIASLLAAVALIGLGAACQPTVPVWTTPTIDPSDPHGTLVVGDSISWQADMSGYLPADGTEYHTFMGWLMADVAPRIHERRDDGTLSVLVLALGTNDANPTWNGGWTSQDEAQWLAIVNELDPNTHVSILLPWVDPVAQPAHAAEIEKARAYLTTLSNIFGTGLVDWRTYATQPGVLGPDGIHLMVPEGGNAAWDVEPTAGAARAAALATTRAITLAEPVEEPTATELEQITQ